MFFAILMDNVLVSACLLGINCRYDGGHACRKNLISSLKGKHVIFACPEQLGGLPTPRSKSKIKKERVINEAGVDVTRNFYRGAREFLKIAKSFRVKELILKSRSPSCGKNGIVTKLLPKNMKVTYIK